jgi:hypothetical protein
LNRKLSTFGEADLGELHLVYDWWESIRTISFMLGGGVRFRV